MILTFSLVFVLCVIGIIVGVVDIFINYFGIGWYVVGGFLYLHLINWTVYKYWWERH